MAANSLHHAKDYLGEFFRRITRKLGKPQAITATAHKLARIVYHLLSTREAYRRAQVIIEAYPGAYILLADATGQLLINTFRAFGALAQAQRAGRSSPSLCDR
jgi:hypothetical protein